MGSTIDKVTQQLQDEGVDKFSKSFDKLMVPLEKAVQK
jgi:transaldolase